VKKLLKSLLINILNKLQIVLTLNQQVIKILNLEKTESKNDSNADEDEGQNEGDADDCLQLQEKILLTEKVRKLNNEGLASVRLFLTFSWLDLSRTNVLLLLKTLTAKNYKLELII